MAEVIMPKMGDAMTEGKIIAWRKQQGDQIGQGEPIAEIETEKVNVEIEAEASGTLTQILVVEGETAPVGAVIAYIDGEGAATRAARAALERRAAAPPEGAAAAGSRQPAEAAAPLPPEAEATAASRETTVAPRSEPQPPAAAAPTAAPPLGAPRAERVRASPLARRVGAEHGVELAHVTGTGPGGRVEKRDVEQYLQTRRPRPVPAAAAPGAGVPARRPEAEYEDRALSPMRQAIARAMTTSKPGAPHIYLTAEIDVTDMLALRRTLLVSLEEQQVRPTVNDIVLLATARALRKVPELNAHFLAQNNSVRVFSRVHVGNAVAVPDGLIVTVLRDADQKPLAQLAAEAKELAGRAKERRLRQDEYMGATFTVSNLGMFDVDDFMAVLNPPQVGILAVGTATRKPVVRAVDGQDRIESRDIMRATVSADHRAVDGVTAARFLQELKRLLQNPLTMLV